MKPSWSLSIAGTAICGGSLLVATLLASSYYAVTIVHASARLLHQEVTHPASEAEASKNRKSVLVELITSDECEACQSAEQVLTHIDRDQSSLGRDVIVLSEHIKPEDLSVQRPSEYLSPTDPTRRQENYQQLGTSSQPAPIFLINGIVQSEQATSSQIEDSVRSAPANTVPLTLTAVEVRGRNVTFNLDGGPTTNGYVDVYAALVEPSVSTKWTDQ